MKVITGRVVDGKVELEADVEDSTLVAVLAADESGFRLSAQEEEELTKALQEIRRGEFADGHELLRELRDAAGR